MTIAPKPVRDWGLPYNNLLLCAGPCSAESEAQVLATARGLAGCKLSFFRSGIWKPRTHPGCFEGIGVDALPWLKRVKEELGIPVGVEAGTPEHAEACLEHGIDVIWIGARTTPNPFAVQAIADALKGVDVVVLVKNPVSPDLELWVGAIERVCNAGITRVGAIHRGFTTQDEKKYRNAPMWRVPIELKRRLPDLPLICDPSHICGRSDLIYPVAQEALDLLYDGLMVEVHNNPSEALSDAKQQLTPTEFVDMLGRLNFNAEESSDNRFQNEIERLRHNIDEVDERLIELLGRRMEIVQEMGEEKRRSKVSTLQPHRWQNMLADRIAKGCARGLSLEFMSTLYQSIHEEAIRQQEQHLFGRDQDSCPADDLKE